jgi:hypothetical protein
VTYVTYAANGISAYCTLVVNTGEQKFAVANVIALTETLSHDTKSYAAPKYATFHPRQLYI